MSGVTRSDLGENVKEKFLPPGGIALRLVDVMAFQLRVTCTDQVGSCDKAFEFDSGSTRFEAGPTKLTSLFKKPSRLMLAATTSSRTLSNFVIIRSNTIQQDRV
jgi:hypothetical protein